jgi:hypothetical protein
MFNSLPVSPGTSEGEPDDGELMQDTHKVAGQDSNDLLVAHHATAGRSDVPHLNVEGQGLGEATAAAQGEDLGGPVGPPHPLPGLPETLSMQPLDNMPGLGLGKRAPGNPLGQERGPVGPTSTQPLGEHLGLGYGLGNLGQSQGVGPIPNGPTRSTRPNLPGLKGPQPLREDEENCGSHSSAKNRAPGNPLVSEDSPIGHLPTQPLSGLAGLGHDRRAPGNPLGPESGPIGHLPTQPLRAPHYRSNSP